MTKFFSTTLIACVLGLLATQAQTPFMGTVKYVVNMSNFDPLEAPKAMYVIYGKEFIKVWPEFADTSHKAAREELLFDYTTNEFYRISHKQKQLFKMPMKGLPPAPQLVVQPNQTAHIAGFSASAYWYQFDKENTFNIWLADSIPLSVPAIVKGNNELFLFGQDKLMLKIEGSNKLGDDAIQFSLLAVDITPSASFNAPFKLPENYTLVDVPDIQRLQDSLLQAFKDADSALAVSVDSMSTLPAPPPPPPPPPPVKKPAPIKKKNSKPNTTKGRKPVS